uniref:Venom protein 27.7 n=1 Tax=Lychas mucronatus TaxID=172552 RepID=NDBT_LYCMC|nr:RecName: Full=Venom protein 27.7; Flags: Precursor [Lychas mucronatus]
MTFITLTIGLSLRTIFLIFIFLPPPHLLARTTSLTRRQTRKTTIKVFVFILPFYQTPNW